MRGVDCGQAVIKYQHAIVAWRGVESEIEKQIIDSGARTVLEVGGGANPLFDKSFIDAHGLAYTLLDISATELAKAPDCYHKVVADICASSINIEGRFDFIFSRMLAEHVPNGAAFHRNTFKLLSPGGRAFHFFPTLWAPPFVVNRLLPERLAETLLHAIQAGRERSGKVAKFPALYSWCRGPTAAQVRRFESLGYEVVSYVGFFGHGAYYLKFPLLLRWHSAFTRWLVAHPQPWLTSFAQVTLKKPI
jgi:2-polyprenyl-3-methyl-5-hydroxy-6-metoxy-1,4-benzoquinol methylase